MSAFTPAELELRKGAIHGSDVAPILGLSPYSDAVQVYGEKTGRLPPVAETFAMACGTAMEPVIAAEYAKIAGVAPEVVTMTWLKAAGFAKPKDAIVMAGTRFSPHRPVTLKHPDYPWARATPDRAVRVAGRRRALEIKHTSERLASEWGPTGSEGATERALCQVTWTTGIMRALGLVDDDFAEIACGIGNGEVRLYTVRADQEMFEMLLAEMQDFRDRCLVGDEKPEATSPEAAARLVRMLFPRAVEGKEKVTANAEAHRLALELAARRAALDEAKAAELAARAALQGWLGEKYGVRGDGWEVSWANVPGSTYSVTREPGRRFSVSGPLFKTDKGAE